MKQFLPILLILIAFRSVAQQPVYATVSGGDLFSFNLTNCTRQFIGSTGHGFGDIAFTADGRLWGIAGGRLFQIDKSTAAAVLVEDTQIGAVSLIGLNDSILLAEYGQKLYGINCNTALSYYIDTIGYQAAGDLTWYDDDLYMVTSAGQIIKMTLNNSFTKILSIVPIGGGVPTCEGAVTAAFPDDYHSIVGFNGPNLIKICQIDGSTEMLCPDLNTGGTPGAASMRIATQVPPPTVCHVSSAAGEIGSTEPGFDIFPNPARSELTIRTSGSPDFNFRIYNALGRPVRAGSSDRYDTSVSVSELPAGVYCLELSVDQQVVRKLFVVER